MGPECPDMVCPQHAWAIAQRSPVCCTTVGRCSGVPSVVALSRIARMADTDLVPSFCAVTGAEDDVALQMLSATNNDLEAAINLFFAAGLAPTGIDQGPQPAGSQTALPSEEQDQALAERLQQ